MFYLFLILFLVAIFWAFKKFRRRLSSVFFKKVGENLITLELKVPRKEEEGWGGKASAMSMEGVFAGLHGLLKEQSDENDVFSFEIFSNTKDGIKFYVTCSQENYSFLESQLYAQYPAIQLLKVKDPAFNIEETRFISSSEIGLQKSHIFPLKTYNDIEGDTMASITSTMSQIGVNEEIWFQMVFSPAADTWQQEGHKYLNRLKAGKVNEPSFKDDMLKLFLNELWNLTVKIISDLASLFGGQQSSPDTFATKGPTPAPKLSAVEEIQAAGIENKMSKMGFYTQLRVLVAAESDSGVRNHSRSFVASLNQFSQPNLNSLRVTSADSGARGMERYRSRFLSIEEAFVLNSEELSSLYHLPSHEVETPNIGWAHSRKSEPPANLPQDNCTFIGETVYRDKKVRFGLANTDDRLRHMYVIGKSGTGKSTLFETMISQDIEKGFGVGVLDPHGETIDKILDRIPAHRVDDVIYFDPADTERPLGLNLMELDDTSQKNLMASALVAAIHHHFEYSWGPRLEYLLNYAILTLLEVPGTTMLGITRLLEDDNYRKFILHFVKDPVVLKFWETEYKNMKSNQKLITEAVAPIQNKVNRFLSSTTIRNILGQKNSTLNLREAMESGKIVLMNLSIGKIGEDNANLLGALLVSRIQFMALQRAKMPYEQRRPFYLYVDEFQNFATGSFESILSESRKYGLGLYLTHQYTAQLPEQLLRAVLGNVGTIVTFALGTPDAKALAGEFAPYFTDTDIISLERFHVYMKLMVDGMTSSPFSAKILLPWKEDECIVPKSGNKQWVYELSRQKYGMDRVEIEKKIAKWVDTSFDKGLAISMSNTTAVVTANEPVVTPAVPNTPATENHPTPSGTVEVIAAGHFDGKFVVDEQGVKHEVPANYAAKSMLVYGDTLEKYLEDGKERYRQASKVPRQSIEGVLSAVEGGYVAKSGGRDYAVSKIAVEFNKLKVGEKVWLQIPQSETNAPFAAIDVKKLKKSKEKSDKPEGIV